MATNKKLRVLFYINRTRTNKIGKCPINLRISMKGESVTFATQRSINPEFWDTKNGKCYSIIAETKEINSFHLSINFLN